MKKTKNRQKQPLFRDRPKKPPVGWRVMYRLRIDGMVSKEGLGGRSEPEKTGYIFPNGTPCKTHEEAVDMVRVFNSTVSYAVKWEPFIEAVYE